MQYTLRNIPKELDQELRRRARASGKSLNEVAIEAMIRALGLSDQSIRHRDLSDMAGSWIDDPDVDKALADQRQIDDELWT